MCPALEQSAFEYDRERLRPLTFAPGETYQFDWSNEIGVLNGVTTTAKVAHVRLCHTDAPIAPTSRRRSFPPQLDRAGKARLRQTPRSPNGSR
jgi:hypothetical protein